MGFMMQYMQFTQQQHQQQQGPASSTPCEGSAYTAPQAASEAAEAALLWPGGTTGSLSNLQTRHGNAAYGIEVLLYKLQHGCEPSAEHLATAAARVETWAAEVVQLLLQKLEPSQLKPACMRQAYIAACRTGNPTVLQLLLGVAAADNRHQLGVLAAAADNAAVLQQLLQLDTTHVVQEAVNNQPMHHQRWPSRPSRLVGTLVHKAACCCTGCCSASQPGHDEATLSAAAQRVNPACRRPT